MAILEDAVTGTWTATLDDGEEVFALNYESLSLTLRLRSEIMKKAFGVKRWRLKRG